MEKDGIKTINGLSEEVKQELIGKYGSIEDYYAILYKYGSDNYKAFISKNEAEKSRYESLRFELAHELEYYGAKDGLDIVDEIWGDFDEDLIASKFKNL